LVVEQGVMSAEVGGSALPVLLPPHGSKLPSTPVGSAAELLPGALVALPIDTVVDITVIRRPAVVLVVEVVAAGGVPTMSSRGAGSPVVVSESFQADDGASRLEIVRQNLAAGATSVPTSARVVGSIVAVERGAVDVGISQGTIQIGRSYGGVETIIAQPTDGSAVTEADPEADPQADPESEVDGEAVVPALEGTVVGLAVGDVALVSNEGIVTTQGVDGDPAVVLTVSIVETEPE